MTWFQILLLFVLAAGAYCIGHELERIGDELERIGDDKLEPFD